ncbi:MAG: hypothetical protein ABJC26_13665 [Gemmatimonadaceae bacterium]
MNTFISRNRPKFKNIAALGVAGLSFMSMATVVSAQSKPQIQLAFGHECGDKFLVRNDGAGPVDVEYSLAGTKQRSKLHLNTTEGVEIVSQASGPMELWVNGQLVSTEQKTNKVCAVKAGDQDVIVRGIGEAGATSNGVATAATSSTVATTSSDQVVYVAAQPQRVVYVSVPVGYAWDPYYYGGFGFGYGYDYGYYGYPSYYRGGISVNFSNYSRGVYRAPIYRNTGFRGGFGRPGGGFGGIGRPGGGRPSGGFGGGFGGGHSSGGRGHR